jgi:serine/threonine-protein kinase
VSFEIVRSKTNEPVPAARGWLGMVWLLLMLAVVALLARHNVKNGRADRLGAIRTGVVAATTIFITWLLGADHVPTTSEIGLLIEAMSWAALYVVVLWLIYVALEPTLRRRWPHAMVSWVRLLRGEWRDPQVGRDVLAGVIGGCILLLSSEVIPRKPQLLSEVIMLNGTRQAIAELFSVVTRATLDSMVFLVFFVVLRIIVRRDWLAALGLFAVFAGLSGFQLPDIIDAAVLIATFLFLNRRFGYLAWVMAFFTSLVLQITPVLLPVASWNFGAMLTGFGCVVLLAVYGFVVSLGGRALFTADFLED